MSWALKGLGGPLKDQSFPLSGGTTMGRQGNIVILDHKASVIHARIGVADDGSLFLEDNSSKNGTRVDNERISRVKLTHGLVFYIGDQGFEVFETPNEIPERPTTVAPPKVKRPWYDILGEFLLTNESSFKDQRRGASALTPALVLEFVRGLQVNFKWTLGYAPRKIGATVLDLPIWEPGAPPVCFELLPSLDGVTFKTAHPKIVQLNGEAVDTRVLRKGDTIRILETIIEVDFKE